jgi:hypothetical protein
MATQDSPADHISTGVCHAESYQTIMGTAMPPRGGGRWRDFRRERWLQIFRVHQTAPAPPVISAAYLARLVLLAFGALPWPLFG